jgi:Ni,Fe-hydrogenase I cytochrome b subunit
MPKELPKEELVNLMYIFNAILRLEYWLAALLIAQIIMIPKPGKNPIEFLS